MRGSGKNSKIAYYLRSYLRQCLPRWRTLVIEREGISRRLTRELERRADRDYILERVDYYCKLSTPTPLPPSAPRVGALRKSDAISSVYYFDAYEILRYFPRSLRWEFLFGDVIHVPAVPTIVKSRPIAGDNVNSVVLKLEKNRHFTFLRDKIPFEEKADRAIFRGDINHKPHRVRFLERWYGTERVDAGVIGPMDGNPEEWRRPKISLWKHLDYKYILAIEGVDVASNLKWIMSSNSLPLMPRPRYETWFMEGKLVAGVHYVEIAEDYSDLLDKMNYYTAHPTEAVAISQAAHAYIDQFRDRRRERLISKLVLAKYFSLTQ